MVALGVVDAIHGKLLETRVVCRTLKRPFYYFLRTSAIAELMTTQGEPLVHDCRFPHSGIDARRLGHTARLSNDLCQPVWCNNSSVSRGDGTQRRWRHRTVWPVDREGRPARRRSSASSNAASAGQSPLGLLQGPTPAWPGKTKGPAVACQPLSNLVGRA
ncbi:conserved hypothetical protein (fragment) [Ralstonia solanacearum K60]